MTKNEFLSELRYALRHLPQEEIDNALNYYEEFFHEAGPQRERQIIDELISPNAVASKIIGEYAVHDAERSRRKKRSRPLWIAILAICASPVAVPLALSGFVLVVALFIVFLAFGISGAAFAVSGIVSLYAGVWAASASLPTGMFYIGLGLLAISISGSLLAGTALATKNTFFALQKALGKILIRRGAK